jgi:hypothetical protein
VSDSTPDPDDQKAPSPEPPTARRTLLTGLAFLLGGLAMIFIGWVWGRATALDGVYAGAVVVVGVVGTVAGALMLGRLILRR